jgi:hypothetical protein
VESVANEITKTAAKRLRGDFIAIAKSIEGDCKAKSKRITNRNQSELQSEIKTIATRLQSDSAIDKAIERVIAKRSRERLQK